MTLAATIGVLGYDPFGPSQAGPATRSWQLAKALAHLCAVELWYEGEPPDASEVPLLRLKAYHPELLLAAAEKYTALLLPAQAALRDRRFFDVPCARIIDCFDPFPLETAHLIGGASPQEQRFRTGLGAWASLHAVAHGDYWLVANEHQRAYLGGLLVASGRMTPGLTQNAGSEHGRTLLVPFGIEPGPPADPALAAPLLERWGIPADAKIALWTGGLWPWMDPLTVLRAVELLDRPDLHLVFPGAVSPHAGKPEAPVVAQLQAAIKESPVRARVHLVDWVPRDLWAPVARRADVHVCAHHPGWEVWVSERTRYLESIRARRPLVATLGDPLGEYLWDMGIAQLAPAQLSIDFAEQLEATLEGPEPSNESWDDMAELYGWEGVTDSLLEAVTAGLTPSPDREANQPIRDWIASYPIPAPPGKLQKLWDRIRRGS